MIFTSSTPRTVQLMSSPIPTEMPLVMQASQMGALFQSGVAASLMQRVAVMIVYLVMGLAFAWPVWRRYTRGKKEELSHE